MAVKRREFAGVVRVVTMRVDVAPGDLRQGQQERNAGDGGDGLSHGSTESTCRGGLGQLGSCRLVRRPCSELRVPKILTTSFPEILATCR